MKRSLAVASGLALLAVIAGHAGAQGKTITGLTVMQQVEKTNRSKDEVAKATMKISKGKTVTKERELTMSAKTAPKYEDRSLMRFTAGDERGTAFLTHQHGEGADDQWIYLASLKKTKRLAAGEKKESFVGSDFAYEDLRTENLDAHTYKLLGKKDVKQIKKSCWQVEAVAKAEDEKASTGYAKRIIWVSTDDNLVRRIDYFSKDSGKLMKSQFFSRFTTKKAWKGFTRPSRAVMINKTTNTRTEFLFKERKINEGVKDDVFSERGLEKG